MPGNGGNTAWHTDRDQLEVADPGVLLTDIRLYAVAVARLAAAPSLPLDPGALVASLQRQLETYADRAGARFDLTPARAALASLADRLAAFEALDPLPEVATATQLAVLRHLVPLDYTRGTRYRRDIGLPAAPLTHLAVAEALDRYPPAALGFALASLTRGQNHVVAAVEAAAEAIPGSPTRQ